MLMHSKGNAQPLTDAEKDWFEKATQSLLSGETLEGVPSKTVNMSKPMIVEDQAAPIVTTTVQEDPEDMGTSEDITEDDPERLREQLTELRNELLKMSESQGTRSKIEAAMREYGDDLYLLQQRGVILAFRPMYWDEVEELTKKPDKEADKWLVEQCVIVGLDKLVGKRARAGVYSNLARKILSVSDHQSDLNDIIIPTSY